MEERTVDQSTGAASLSARRLLEPLRYLRGVGDLHITGEVSESYKQDIKNAVTKDLLSKEALVEGSRSFKKGGDAAYVSGEYALACSTYQEGLDALDQGHQYAAARIPVLLAGNHGSEEREALHELRLRRSRSCQKPSATSRLGPILRRRSR